MSTFTTMTMLLRSGRHDREDAQEHWWMDAVRALSVIEKRLLLLLLRWSSVTDALCPMTGTAHELKSDKMLLWMLLLSSAAESCCWSQLREGKKGKFGRIGGGVGGSAGSRWLRLISSTHVVHKVKEDRRWCSLAASHRHRTLQLR